MSKSTGLFILILISTLLCISCKQESATKEPTYNIFQSPESTDASSIITDNPSTPSDTNMPTDNGTLNISPTDSSVKEEPWPYPLDFNGITPTGAYDTYKTGNLIFNMNGINPTLSYLICPDLDNDMIYYVNYGDDNYIYKLKDGLSTLVLEKEAFQLSLWENKLYFLARHETSDRNEGDIYCYNLGNGELQLLQKAKAYYLLVDSLGIYYEEIINSDTSERRYYRLGIDGNSLEKLDNRYYLSYYDYQIIQNKTAVVLQHKDTKEEFFIAPYEYGSWGLTIYDNHIILHRDSVFYIINLLNGDKKAIQYSNSKSQVVDYVIIDNNMYLRDKKIDLSTGTVSSYGYISYDKKDALVPEYLSTNGNQIYAIVHYSNLNLRKLVNFEYDNVKLEIKVKELEE